MKKKKNKSLRSILYLYFGILTEAAYFYDVTLKSIQVIRQQDENFSIFARLRWAVLYQFISFVFHRTFFTNDHKMF